MHKCGLKFYLSELCVKVDYPSMHHRLPTKQIGSKFKSIGMCSDINSILILKNPDNTFLDYHIYPKYWNTFYLLTKLVLKFEIVILLPLDVSKILLYV